MANQYAVPDGNNNAGILAHSGTAGTAETRRLVASADGGLVVANEGAAPLTTIDFAHHEIHEGDHFFVNGFGTVGAGTSLDFLVTTSTINAHMRLDVVASFQTEVYIYENPNYGTFVDGTGITPFNSNRNSAGTSTLTLVLNRTIGTAGTLLSSTSFGGSTSPQNKIGGGINREDELILKNNEDYVFRITSRSAGNIISYKGFWYEDNA